MSPSVSVVIPVFNRQEAVRRAIASVLTQTYQDFEIIVVDDASTDQTVSVIASIADPRIVLIRHVRRLGGSATRNSGITASRGSYVAFLDSDDEWMPDKLNRQIELFKRSNEVGFVYAGYEIRLPDGDVMSHIPRVCTDLPGKLLIDNVVGGASVGMVRREVFERVGLFDETLRCAQDVDFWLRVSDAFPADFVPDVLVRIWQQNTVDRITTDIASLISGREVFFAKHRERMQRAGVVHLWLRNVGWFHHRLVGNRPAARSHYVAALRAKPLAPFTYVLLLSAWMPVSWLDRVAGVKHRLLALAGAIRDTRRNRSAVSIEDSEGTRHSAV
jgi:glycosyltransferase involved in cell wall biosynthesis